MNKNVWCANSVPDSCIKIVKDYLKAFKKRDSQKNKVAVVFDIDGTLVSETHKPSENSKPIAIIKEIYDQVTAKDIDVFFISARYNDQETIDFTRDELVRLGYKTYNNIFLMPTHYKNRSVEHISLFKCATRVHIQNVLGYQIILNVGNTWQDLCLQFPYLQKAKSTNTELMERLLLLSSDDYIVIRGLPDISWLSFKLPETMNMKQVRGV
jgi:predicted secreted acid phosphatase